MAPGERAKDNDELDNFLPNLSRMVNYIGNKKPMK